MQQSLLVIGLLVVVNVSGPLFKIPRVEDTRESIRTRVGHITRGLGIQSSSNIMAGILELESGSQHRTNRDPKLGVKRGRDDDMGAGQVVIGHEKRLKKVWGSNFSLTNLNDNIRASCMIPYFMWP